MLSDLFLTPAYFWQRQPEEAAWQSVFALLYILPMYVLPAPSALRADTDA